MNKLTIGEAIAAIDSGSRVRLLLPLYEDGRYCHADVTPSVRASLGMAGDPDYMTCLEPVVDCPGADLILSSLPAEAREPIAG